MSPHPLYPLRFKPIYQYRIWGGRRFENLLCEPLPEGPVGEAWILSDREDFPSRVTDGALKGETFSQLLQVHQKAMMGDLAGQFDRFPLLLKFLDAQVQLSVQVHPSDEKKEFLPPGERGKTEAWVVLEAGPKSQIYAGLYPGATEASMRKSSADGTVAKHLAGFVPKEGDGIFIPAGTVHALGDDVVVFEVQQNSDVTFRLYDWDRVDPKSGKLRDLQVEEAISCIDFSQGPVEPVSPIVVSEAGNTEERLFSCEFFEVNRLKGRAPVQVGKTNYPTVLVCLKGNGALDQVGTSVKVSKGDVYFLPAEIGICSFQPEGEFTVLEVRIPEP